MNFNYQQHFKDGIYVSPYSGKTFLSLKSFSSHIRNMNRESKFQQIPKLSCLCCKGTIDLGNYERHTKSCFTNRNTKKNCLQCNASISINKKFCNQRCAALFNGPKRSSMSREKQRQSIKDTIKVKSAPFTKIYPCLICGKYHPTRVNNCCTVSTRLLPSLGKWFGLDLTIRGTQEFKQTLDTLSKKLQAEYDVSSIVAMAKNYGHDNVGNFSKLLTGLDIQFKSQSEAALQAIANGRKIPVNPNFKNGYIPTSSEPIFYRSSYEQRIFQELLDMQIQFEVEKHRIVYFDSISNKQRIAIPDITAQNKIIEIKSDWTYDEINMLDKCVAYTKEGFSVFMIKEFELFKYNNVLHQFTKLHDHYLSIF
jgi:hypothetical protein